MQQEYIADPGLKASTILKLTDIDENNLLYIARVHKSYVKMP